MAEKQQTIGSCYLCKQGMLMVEKEISSGKMILHCDECEAEWENPEDALKGENATRFKYGRTTDPTYEEILAIGWGKYLK